MNQIILANKLFVPERQVEDSILWQFRHQWTEVRTEPVVGEDGKIIVEPNGKQMLDRIEIDHTFEGYRQLLSGQGDDYVGLPRGNLEHVSDLLCDVIDLRGITPMSFPLQMAEHVLEDDRWPDQKRCVDQWSRAGGGLVIGETGAGKTLIGIGAAIALGLETLILSKRSAGYEQWEGEFRQHTDIELWEQKLKRRLIGPYGHKKRYPISVSTIQAFLHPKGYHKLIRDQRRFGLVIADEIHELVAPEFVRVLSLWAPLYWLGLTATIERPDHREHLAYWHLGPIRAKLNADQMRPKVTILHTPFEAPDWLEGRTPYSRNWKWNKLLSLISDHDSRYEFILRHLMRDLDDGRLVAVIAERTAIIRRIADLLRREDYKVAYVDGSVPKRQRERIYEEVRQGKRYRCICGGKVMDAMVSIKPLDCLHLVSPVNAKHRIKQIFGRTRRPDESKATPLIRYYADQGGQLTGACKNVLKVCEAEGWEIENQVRSTTKSFLTRWTAR